MIEVVSGVLVRGGRIFLVQRPASRDYPFRWESPGGKVEPDESHHSALRRELREELGLEVGAIGERALWCGKPVPERDDLFVLLYPVLDFSREPLPLEGQPGFGWFLPYEAKDLLLCPGNRAAWHHLTSYVAATSDP